MIKRLSIAQKLVIVLVCMLVLFSVVLTSILISRASADLIRQQSKIQTQYYKQYQLLNGFINDRMIRLIEGFTADISNDDIISSTMLEQQLQEQRELLQLRWQVDDIWLLQVGSTSPVAIPDSLFDFEHQQLVDSITQQQRPISRIICTPECAHYLGVPVLTQDTQLSIIGVRYALSELLGSFAQSADARVATIVVPKEVSQQVKANAGDSLVLDGALTAVNRKIFEQLIAAIPPELSFKDFYQYGHVVVIDNEASLLNLVPISLHVNREHFILTVTNISESYFALREYYWVVVSAAIGLSFIFLIMVNWLLRSYRRKLENLSHRLPLLAHNRFEEFRDLSIGTSVWFEDELDQLEESAESLANNLEKLNQQALEDKLQLEKMAMFDGLTGLPNRSMLMFQINKHIASLKRTNNAVALMFLDLDDFKRINDSHGHGVGDALLKEVAKRLSLDLRETDIAARFGGDEYAILITDVENKHDAEIVADKLLKRFENAFKVREFTFFINISIGVAITEDSRVTAAELLRHADIAMYEAKTVSQSAYKVYDSAMNLKIIRRVELENEARVALLEGQFSLALQPKVALDSGRLIGFESLIRWNHPEKGAISPVEFIPVLERTSLMVQVDYWVIARSLFILAELSVNGYRDIGIAINLSAGQFADSNLVDYLRQQLRHHDIDASRVELELTETTLVEDLTRACEVMNQVRDLGCRIAIDDFGTGYSSLSYLKNMPADVVKVDQSFVSGMLDDESDRNIVYSTISMVRGMGITVVAEGIESYPQYDLLRHFECDIGQGYFISKPINEADLWDVVRENCVSGIWSIPTV